jgi:hypothetical protein
MPFLAWPEIESFHNIRKFVRVDPEEWFRAKEQLSGTSTVQYKCKVKLHGTNAAVQVHQDGTVLVQSRTNLITPENDNAGFARWAMTNKDKWNFVCDVGIPHGSDVYCDWIIYGEWCGPGIQKGVAISEIPKKIFAVFAARPMNGSDQLVVEPEALELLVGGISDVYVLPWYDRTIDINWKQSDEELTKSTEEISKWVLSVEASDPWVKATFGVKGTGEGLVFYPTSTPHQGWENFNYLVFKAKGEAHKNIKTAAPAQVNAEAAASIEAFAELTLTQARLEQGATAVGGYDLKQTGKFVSWITADVQKECQDELEASKLDWKTVQRPLTDRARNWFIQESKRR